MNKLEQVKTGNNDNHKLYRFAINDGVAFKIVKMEIDGEIVSETLSKDQVFKDVKP